MCGVQGAATKMAVQKSGTSAWRGSFRTSLLAECRLRGISNLGLREHGRSCVVLMTHDESCRSHTQDEACASQQQCSPSVACSSELLQAAGTCPCHVTPERQKKVARTGEVAACATAPLSVMGAAVHMRAAAEGKGPTSLGGGQASALQGGYKEINTKRQLTDRPQTYRKECGVQASAGGLRRVGGVHMVQPCARAARQTRLRRASCEEGWTILLGVMRWEAAYGTGGSTDELLIGIHTWKATGEELPSRCQSPARQQPRSGSSTHVQLCAVAEQHATAQGDAHQNEQRAQSGPLGSGRGVATTSVSRESKVPAGRAPPPHALRLIRCPQVARGRGRCRHATSPAVGPVGQPSGPRPGLVLRSPQTTCTAQSAPQDHGSHP